MQGWHTIDLDPGAGLIRMAMGGFFDPTAVTRVGADFQDALRRLGLPPGDHLTLCDITAMNIQSQDVVGLFAKLLANPAVRSRRMAFVTAATLARLQAKRLTERPEVMFFTEVREARTWLMEARAKAA